MVIRRFANSHFPGHIRFPDRRFPDGTIPGQTISRTGQDDSRTDVPRTLRFSGTIFAKTLSVMEFCVNLGLYLMRWLRLGLGLGYTDIVVFEERYGEADYTSSKVIQRRRGSSRRRNVRLSHLLTSILLLTLNDHLINKQTVFLSEQYLISKVTTNLWRAVFRPWKSKNVADFDSILNKLLTCS